MNPTVEWLLKINKTLQLVFILVAISLASLTETKAGKLDLMAGYFDLNAKVGSVEGQVSAFGAYKFSYAQSIFSDHLDIEIGYTLLMSETFGGDLAYGIEAGLNYYPFTPSTSIEGRSQNASLEITPLWRPFVGASFNQRQAQSTNSGYAGFGVVLGTERALNSYFDLKTMVRYNFLSGARSATANELTVFLGITMPFSFGK